MLGEKSFFEPYLQVQNEAELLSKWALDELTELQNGSQELWPGFIEDIELMRTEMAQQEKVQLAQFDLLFTTFRENGYEELWPGITGLEAEARATLLPLFLSCQNKAQSRLFGH